MEIAVREFRKSPFCRQDKTILRLINENTTRKELPAIRNLYSTLTEIASNQARENISIYLFDIAKISWLSERTVSKWLDQLDKLWIVFIKPQERWVDGKYKAKEIWLTDGTSTEGKFKESSEKDEGKIDNQLTDIIESNIEDSIEINIENNTNEQQVAQEWSGKNPFFWFRQKYPLKKSKKKAESIYTSLLKNSKDPSELHKQILDGVEKYRREIEYKTKKATLQNMKFDRHYIKHPTTRLGQGCREDEYEYENKQTVIKTSQRKFDTIIVDDKPMTAEDQKAAHEMLQKTRMAILSKSK